MQAELDAQDMPWICPLAFGGAEICEGLHTPALATAGAPLNTATNATAATSVRARRRDHHHLSSDLTLAAVARIIVSALNAATKQVERS